MKILHLNTADVSGGAGRSVHRLCEAQRLAGLSAHILSQERLSDAIHVHVPEGSWANLTRPFRRKIDELPLKLYPERRKALFSINWVPGVSAEEVNGFGADIVHIHWVNSGFLRLESIADIDAPIVWTMVDEWLFTGGCHYDSGCDQFKNNCSRCPHLKIGLAETWITKSIQRRKAALFERKQISVVAISKWLAEQARQSTILSNTAINIIPPCLDTDRFRPVPRAQARKLLGLDEFKKYILFGAVLGTTQPRKGYALLRDALFHLREQLSDAEANQVDILIFGSVHSDRDDLPFPLHVMGRMHSDVGLLDDIPLVLLYSAADVLLAPSTQEAFGQVASEALACGTPAVGFDGTGLADLIDHKETGYLASPESTRDLCSGIRWGLFEAGTEVSEACRAEAVKRFSYPVIAREYLTLYNTCLA